MPSKQDSKINCYVKEDSWIARLAARKLNARSVAIVIGSTIHLHNATRQDLLANKRWLRHEVRHLKQFRQYGFLPFIFRYLFESLRNGYYNNRFEQEARASEKDENILEGVVINDTIK